MLNALCFMFKDETRTHLFESLETNKKKIKQITSKKLFMWKHTIGISADTIFKYTLDDDRNLSIRNRTNRTENNYNNTLYSLLY